LSTTETTGKHDSNHNNEVINDALRITRMIRKHLADSDCKHCRSLLEDVLQD